MPLKNKKQGLLIVISAPSGCGKTTLCHRLLKSQPNLVRSVSMTTRLPRSGEKKGKDYFFVSKKQFFSLRGKKAFLEWAKVFGQYYGTPAGFVKQALGQGKDVLLSIDIQGALKIKGKYPQGVYIFILPPSLKILEERLRKRALDSAQEINKRFKLARHEIAHHEFYDYTLVNDNLNLAVKAIKSIISAGKNKRG